MVLTALWSLQVVCWKYAAGTDSGVVFRFLMVILRVCGRRGVVGIVLGDLVRSMRGPG